MVSHIKNSILDLLHLIYPNLCIACSENIPIKSDIFCFSCKMHIPYSDSFHVANNELETRLLGRFPFESANSLFNFTAGSSVEQVLYKLKYNNQPNIGKVLGQHFGKKLLETKDINFDFIVPIPLHAKKQFKRGYNQSTKFALGISEAIQVPVKENILVKTYETSTQTKKNRLDRLENVLHSFEIKKGKSLEHKHILLVDDVVTTGATIEAAAIKLLDISGVKLSLGFIAMKLFE